MVIAKYWLQYIFTPISHFSSAKYYSFKSKIELQSKTQSYIDKTNTFKANNGWKQEN